MKTAYCFITDGVDRDNHIFAVESLRRYVPDAVCVTLHDGEYHDRLPCEELVDFRGEFGRIFGNYTTGVVDGIRAASFARYILPAILPDRFDRIVYLDNDAIVVSPLFADIESVDIGDCDVGACPYVVGRGAGLASTLAAKIGTEPASAYYHTGVLVMPGSMSDDMIMLLANAHREMQYRKLDIPVHDLANWKLKICPLAQHFNAIVPGIDPKNTYCVHYSGDKKWLMPLVKRGDVEWTFCS